jgi:hypothetical protein
VIVDPDFLDHWRTRMLVDLLGGDELAPMYVIRVWGHCQTRRATEFEVPPAGLKAICRAPHDAAMFEQAMIEAGFIERAGALLRVPKWADHNAKLIANWKNGQGGGRPKGGKEEPTENPPKTQEEPNENPTLTHTEPIREEKRREEEKPTQTLASEGLSEPIPKHSRAHGTNQRALGTNPRATGTNPRALCAGFERFWSAYPRRRNRGQAEKAWAKLKPDAELLERILQAVEVAKRRDDWRKDDGRFVPYPATWLNAKGWEDDPGLPAETGDWWLALGFGSEQSALAAREKVAA